MPSNVPAERYEYALGLVRKRAIHMLKPGELDLPDLGQRPGSSRPPPEPHLAETCQKMKRSDSWPTRGVRAPVSVPSDAFTCWPVAGLNCAVVFMLENWV